MKGLKNMANEKIPPQAGGAGQPPQPPKPDLNELLGEKAQRLKVLEGEFGALGQKLDEEFYGSLPTLLTEEELDLRLDDDPSAFLRAVEAKKEAFKAERLGASQEEIDALRQEVGSLQDEAEREAAKSEFLAAHPDANVGAMNEFVKNGITVAQLKELNSLNDYAAAYEFVWEAMGGAKPKGKAQPEEPSLPPSQDLGAGGLNGEPAAADDEAYLRAIGVK
jgi:hypothetical protein